MALRFLALAVDAFALHLFALAHGLVALVALLAHLAALLFLALALFGLLLALSGGLFPLRAGVLLAFGALPARLFALVLALLAGLVAILLAILLGFLRTLPFPTLLRKRRRTDDGQGRGDHRAQHQSIQDGRFHFSLRGFTRGRPATRAPGVQA